MYHGPTSTLSHQRCLPSTSHKAARAEAHSMAADLVAVETCFSDQRQPTKPASVTSTPRLHADCQHELQISDEKEGCLL